MSELDRKLFLGGRFKRLRGDLGLTQTQMAQDLGVSASYLNHIERNQRPVTAQVLLKLAATYDLDMRTFTSEADPAGEAHLSEVLADPMFADLKVPRREIADLVANAPSVAEALLKLYRAYGERRGLEALEPGSVANLNDQSPSDWVRDQIQSRFNFFPELDELGEGLFDELGGDSHTLEARAELALRTEYGIEVRFMPTDIMLVYQRRYDPHRKRLMLSESLGASSRVFAVLYQLVLQRHGLMINEMVDRARAPDAVSGRLYKVSLLNYLTAATLMPYGRFQAQAEACCYDLEILRSPFGVSFEQAAQRLTTLSRPGNRGVPFFLMRIDQAGNVSKRFAAGKFPFSRFGGACPRWNIHQAFQTPGRIITQVIETPDKTRYFTLSRTIDRSLRGWEGGVSGDQAVGLGCELKYAEKLIYAKGLDLTNPAAIEVGPMCRLCERPYCRERAAPPVTRPLQIDEWIKGVTAFPFAT
ncbi:short-chain fatty acyl-CoA regulator family protein [Asticcacaulis sp. ZE23SCel15]|uniref:helix-turn-helix domain-containing protein n=1 Tax=Asticcacaulis sp. ZE23SCel15 TaxID=3059027 RepID=UPI00265E04F8|nr:helix-turn-helix transcriptional regulator [Asticcacaulis sp. ZE23SCel15]WKL57094.1 short-chain fatty acyl-CoA regulator family protein [Asticcacaulis sp. ZE23SCel15]